MFANGMKCNRGQMANFILTLSFIGSWKSRHCNWVSVLERGASERRKKGMKSFCLVSCSLGFGQLLKKQHIILKLTLFSLAIRQLCAAFVV